jgi:hypothetical protein
LKYQIDVEIKTAADIENVCAAIEKTLAKYVEDEQDVFVGLVMDQNGDEFWKRMSSAK